MPNSFKYCFIALFWGFTITLSAQPVDTLVKITIGGKSTFFTSKGNKIEKIESRTKRGTAVKQKQVKAPEPLFNIEEEFEQDDDWEITDPASRIAATITTKDLRRHLTILASDKFEGRETCKKGQKLAAEYIAGEFEKYGLPKKKELGGSYLQKVPITSEEWKDIGVEVNGKKFKNLKDFYSFPKSNRPRIVTTRDEVVFLGYGIDDKKYSDYDGVDVKGKIIMVYQGEPFDQDSMSYITGDDYPSVWTTDYKKKLQIAKKKGVRAVLMIERSIPFYVSKYNYQLNTPFLRLGELDPARVFANSIYISPVIAKEIIGKKFDKVVEARDYIRQTGKPQNVNLNCKISLYQDETHKLTETENVIGIIEGTDPYLKNEYVVITAHYDHLGKLGEEIFYGADDNGSGTSAILEIAEAFAIAKQEGIGPKRSVVIMAVSGEEKGLLGSEYYTENPTVPIPATIANVNVDMIGRTDEKHTGKPNYIYVIGADRLSTDLHKINEAANTKYTKLALDYKYNEKDDPNRYYYRSDHYNFAQKGIPSVFFFNGTHRDYHRITDTVDKIQFKKMQRVTRLVFLTSLELANRKERIKVDNILPKN